MGKQVSQLPKKQIKWQTVVNVNSGLLFLCVNSVGAEKKYFQSTLGINYEYQTLYSFDNTIAYSKDDLGTFFGLVAAKVKSDKLYLSQFPDLVYRTADEVLKFAQKVKRASNLKKLSSPAINKVFLEYFDKCAAAFPIVLTSIPLEVIITGELEKFIKEKLKETNEEDKFEYYLQNLTQLSSKETYFQQDYRNLLRIGVKVQKDKHLLTIFRKNNPPQILSFLKKQNEPIYKALSHANEEYSWINMYAFRRNPFTLEEQIGRLKDLLDKDCKKTLENIDRKRKIAKANFRHAMSHLKIKGELARKVAILPELVYLRTYRFDIFTLSAYWVRNLFQEIASRLSITLDDLNYLTVWEVSDLLSGKKSLNQILIKTRKQDFAVIQIDGKLAVITDPSKLAALRKEKQKKALTGIKEIKGRVASKGRAKGPVKIVMHPTQVTKVEKGDVLVAPMTSPDFVVGMLKAVAIVTDHGGVTSHAAIVSRELGIPCIVGTGIATTALHDGDVVEVDAINGVVKIVK